MLQECIAVEPKGLLSGDPALYMIIPLFSTGSKSGQVVGGEFVVGGSVGPVFTVWGVRSST